MKKCRDNCPLCKGEGFILMPTDTWLRRRPWKKKCPECKGITIRYIGRFKI